MSKLTKLIAGLVLLAGVVALTPTTASAQHRHHHWRGGGWHGGFYGGWGFPGWGWGYGWGWGSPYRYYPEPYYYAPPRDCGYVRLRVRRNGHWVLRRVWRCW